ncbi:MAG TPA: hypothetical protein VHF22_07535, partial [Planctomycetota bacterium]|nr:hypothetical protein [Planctomycetota bacterium]
HRSGLLLGIFDEPTATRLLEERGVLAALRARLGGADLRVRLHPDEGIFRIHLAAAPEGPDSVVVELKVRLATGTADESGRRLGFPCLDFLAVDWMLLQDPLRAFPPGRRPLPGQRHPGLGLGEEVVGSIVRTAGRLGAAGVIGIPMYYHAAVLYHRLFAFIDPVEEGRFQALMRDLRGLPLAEAAAAVADGRIRDASQDRVLAWEGREMVLPLADPVRAYLAAPRYADAAARALIGTRFVVEAAPIC